MNEFNFPSNPDYLQDNQVILSANAAQLKETAQQHHFAYVRYNFESASVEESEFPDASLIAEARPDMDFETAEQMAEVNAEALEAKAMISAISTQGLVQMTEAAALIDSYDAQGISKEDQLELASSATFFTASSMTWHEAVLVDQDENNVRVTATTLLDAEGNEAATATTIVVGDEYIERTTNFLEIGGEVVNATTAVAPIEDKLVKRVAETLSVDDYMTAGLVMAGSSLYDVDATLSEIWLKYQGTSKEQEVGPLLEEVRDRANAAHESLLLNSEVGEDGRPSFQYLTELNSYLAKL